MASVRCSTDFLVLGAPLSRECESDLSKLLIQTQWLGSPIAEENGEGPSTGHTFLRIEIDSEALVLRFPSDELWALKKRLASCKARQSCTKSDLPCKVIRPGWTFLRHVFELLRGVCQSYHHIRLNAGMRTGLLWLGPLPGLMEWGFHAAAPKAGVTGSRGLHRCLRLLWVWGHMDSSLARAGVAGIRVPVAKFS